jgi:long-chain acyl-CoA synthetase
MSLAELFRQSRIRTPDKIAVACGERSWTYAELDRITDDIAINLLKTGLECGDRIALHFANSAELAFSYLGCFKAGCVAVPINTRLKYPEIDYVLRHCGAASYIGQPDLFGEAAKSRTRVPGLDRYFLTGIPLDSADACTFESLLQPAGREGALPDVSSEQVAAILYTSGTTARPKGVAHSHRTLAQTAQMMRYALLDEDQVAVVMSSMAHMVGFGMLFLAALLNGATVAIAPALDPTAVLDTFERWRGTYVCGLPAAVHSLVRAQMEAPRDVTSGRIYFCGGDSASPSLQAAFRFVMGRPLCEMYGMTEITPMTWNRPDGVRVGSIGRPGEGIRIRLLDAGERDVLPGEIGEICVQGSHLADGYWQDPEGAVPASGSGWFHTGDLAHCDEDGYYWFAGRKKEVIIRGGSNISPQEVEAAICEHPGVSEAAVIGRHDPVWGESVAACVVLRPGETVTEADLIAFTRERLADYKAPERVLFLSELPKSPVGKIQRRLLREHAADCSR